jgi:DNA-binding IclR family transcriptional regulator
VKDAASPPAKGRTRLVERTFDVLFALNEKPKGCGLGDLSRWAGLSGATTLRIVRTLADIDVVSYDEHTRQYSLGPAMYSFATAGLERIQLVPAAQNLLEQLRDDTRETTCIFQRTRHDRVCVASARCARELSFLIEPGQRRSMLLGSPGKVLLAYMSPRERTTFYGKISDRERQKIEAECKQIVATGVAFSRDELVVGGAALAAPIFNQAGEVSALTILGPTARLDKAAVEAMTPQIKAVAAQISRRLGWGANNGNRSPASKALTKKPAKNGPGTGAAASASAPLRSRPRKRNSRRGGPD